MQGPLPPPAPPFLAEGAEIYGYVLRRRLGAGGFGEVWLAANSLDGAEVALKFPRLVADLSLDLLRREAGNYRRLVRAMVALPPAERPPIVAVLHDLTRHDPPALVMEYVSGGDLRTWFAARGGRALSFEESLPIVRDILAALVFAHAHNLVHRDLSPDNVLLDPASRRWKVADFGLGARHRAALPGEESDRNADRQLLSIARSGPVSADLSTLAAGKAHYMAPEQELGGRVGPAADIYALGVIWVQLLMGDLSAGLPATWYPEVPEEARGYLTECLRRGPDARRSSEGLWDRIHADWEFTEEGEEESTVSAAPDDWEQHAGVKGTFRDNPHDTPRAQTEAPSRSPRETEALAVSERGRLEAEATARRLRLEVERAAAERDSQRQQAQEAAARERVLLAELEHLRATAARTIGPSPEANPSPPRSLNTLGEEEPAGASVPALGGVNNLHVGPVGGLGQPSANLVEWGPGSNVGEREREFNYVPSWINLVEWGPGSNVGERRVLWVWPGVEMAFRWIPPGTFTMGSPVSERGRRSNEGPQTRVTITSGLWMGETLVTQRQWAIIMGYNPSYFKGDDLPVECVSWDEVVGSQLGNRSIRPESFLGHVVTATGLSAGLPSEAQWERACRAGATTPFHCGMTISSEQANFDGTFVYGGGKPGISRERTTPVGSFPPNEWGLHDMHGNVWEWCADWYSDRLPGGEVCDYEGPPSGKFRVCRGGSWSLGPDWARAACRDWLTPSFGVNFTGFRVAINQTEH